jgi:hypothetical protein
MEVADCFRILLSARLHGIISQKKVIVKIEDFDRRMLSSGMLRHVALVRTAQCHIPEDHILHSHHHENLISKDFGRIHK